ncbi:uncharacterized protein BO95DRAFT_40811 [Aspergillus brunneoviolaceus CBS 621.78]|uniref:Uncharacterized protein n=1 Tax=Aspergillus brunneoviolaceus CBS 621.78 TaxID=1450534 RepID=A0ACD1FRX9_9EURO|nr:hypothetical protein BO95DRAFT_40811 [Aspergillus brunneoviolaceus CBS 621.78]RAH39723.1 hypothetical protein BO95DRAFT_40811 [Aspergillus brunneoviolaceus CBS 621.78]
MKYTVSAFLRRVQLCGGSGFVLFSCFTVFLFPSIMSDFDGMVWFYLASNHRLGHVFLCECAFFLLYFHFVIVHVERDQKSLSGRLLSMHHPDLHGPLSRIFFPVASRKRVCLAYVCIIITAVFQSFMSAPPVHPVCRADVSLDRVCTFGLGLPRCFHTRRSYKVIFECFSILVCLSGLLRMACLFSLSFPHSL